MKVTLKQNTTGIVKTVKVGFSWTTLFFGFFVPLTRGDFKWTLFMFLLAAVTLGASHLVVPFFYNKTYMNNLVLKGYQPIS